MNQESTVWMRQALRLAIAARNTTPPNPAIGCLIIDSDGREIGRGATQAVGAPHAEIMALREVKSRGQSALGATVVVTLEPCSHHGRTPPCTNSLIEAGVKQVIIAMLDPNPKVAGSGVAALQAAGIAVTLMHTKDPIVEQARELNIGFFSRMIRKTPWVRMKIAASLDGKTALDNGASQWITSNAARTDGHAWRARACAVLTGIGTVLADNPRLDVRLVDTPRQPHLVVVDSRLEMPLDAHLFIAGRALYIYAAVPNDAKKAALEAFGATVIYLPGQQAGTQGKVDLAAMLHDLSAREVNELHVEAGHKLNGSLIREGLVDEFLVYLAPKLIGQGRDMASFGPLSELSQAIPLEFKSTDMLGPDLRIVARIPGRDQF
jgi:diaminohydroxyphosphoribosylaminopyrimidine deaminase/5-amino-6-(5-phosphoribosylamino)uracil reductase